MKENTTKRFTRSETNANYPLCRRLLPITKLFLQKNAISVDYVFQPLLKISHENKTSQQAIYY